MLSIILQTDPGLRAQFVSHQLSCLSDDGLLSLGDQFNHHDATAEDSQSEGQSESLKLPAGIH